MSYNKTITVVETTRDEKYLDEYDYRDYIEITVDGEEVFRVHDGEPEDNNLGRNFSDCGKLVRLLQQAYHWGLDGKNVKFERTTDE